MIDAWTYMMAHFNRTRWNFFTIVEVKNCIGKDAERQIDWLIRKEAIRKRRGCNDTLLEIILDNETDRNPIYQETPDYL